MKLTLYDAFAYGSGETGPFGNQTAAMADWIVRDEKEAANLLGDMWGVPDILVISCCKRFGVPIPKGASVIVPDDDYLSTFVFGLLEAEQKALPI